MPAHILLTFGIYDCRQADRQKRSPFFGEPPVLLLSRKRGQSIVIGDEIRVTIVAVDRNRVQIGIKAPNYVPIYRQEIVERMVSAGEIEPPECLEPPSPAAV